MQAKQWKGQIVAKINPNIQNEDLKKISGYDILFLIGDNPKKAAQALLSSSYLTGSLISDEAGLMNVNTAVASDIKAKLSI